MRIIQAYYTFLSSWLICLYLHCYHTSFWGEKYKIKTKLREMLEAQEG